MLSASLEYTSPLLPHPHCLLYSYPTTICQHWFHTFCCEGSYPAPVDSFPKATWHRKCRQMIVLVFFNILPVTFCTCTFHSPLVSNYVYISKTILHIENTLPQAGKGALAFSALSVPQLPSIGTTRPHFVSCMICNLKWTIRQKGKKQMKINSKIIIEISGAKR